MLGPRSVLSFKEAEYLNLGLTGNHLLQIQDIVRRRQLLTVFREGKDGQQDVDVAILQALLKGETVSRGKGEREARTSVLMMNDNISVRCTGQSALPCAVTANHLRNTANSSQ